MKEAEFDNGSKSIFTQNSDKFALGRFTKQMRIGVKTINQLLNVIESELRSSAF